MAYSSRSRPAEYASKSSHSQVINDSAVKDFLSTCNIPKPIEDISIPHKNQFVYFPVKNNPIQHIIAIDGGFQEVPVRSEFPSATICFFQFGVLIFSISDLESIEYQPFIDPEDMAKLKQIQRFKLTLPIRNVTLKNQSTITHSVRRALYDFFVNKVEDSDTLMESLRWFIYQEYNLSPVPTWTLGSCPHCHTARIPLNRTSISKEFTFQCSNCGGQIYLTDVFRLHEAVDDEIGAGGILAYVTTTIEQILLVHIIRLMLKLKPSLLKEVLFIKDGPLAFFGQTANMHKPMRELVKYLYKNYNLYLAGLEKSGAFVEHADQIRKILPNSTVVLLSNEYTYKYIIPSTPDPNNIFGQTTYYSNKLIFKAPSGGMHVATIPTVSVLANPQETDYLNLDVILTNIDKLKCDMYDNALLPIALVNRLVSLAQFPSSKILKRFAVNTMNK